MILGDEEKVPCIVPPGVKPMAKLWGAFEAFAMEWLVLSLSSETKTSF